MAHERLRHDRGPRLGGVRLVGAHRLPTSPDEAAGQGAAALPHGDDGGDEVVRPSIGKVGRQIGELEHRLAQLAHLDVADLLTGRLADAVVGGQAVDLALQVEVDRVELVELILTSRQDLVLPEVGLHRQHEQRRRDRAGDHERDETEDQVGASLAGDPTVDADRPREIAQPRPSGVGSAGASPDDGRTCAKKPRRHSRSSDPS